jgi:hypothetical protein
MQFDDLCRRTDTFSLNFVASKVCAKYELFAEKIKIDIIDIGPQNNC